MQKALLTYILCLFTGYCLAAGGTDTSGSPAFRDGDLLFQDLDCGPLCEAIETVTPGYRGRHFSHIGMIVLRNDSVLVLEAASPGVILTPLHRFLEASGKDPSGNPKVIAGRVKPAYSELPAKAVAFGLQQLGLPYDHAYIYNNGSYYCSELIYDAYMHARDGKPFFSLSPMRFTDPATGIVFPAWETYYERLGIPVPEGLPGCNPGGIATAPELDIFFMYY